KAHLKIKTKIVHRPQNKGFAMAITVPQPQPHRKSVERAEAESTSVDLRICRIWRDTVCRNGLRSRAMCSPTSSRIIGEDSELLSWQREAAQNIKLRGANNCGTPVLENNIYLMSTFFYLSSSRIIGEDSELLSWQREAAQNIKLRGANNCGTPVLENNIYLMSTFFF